MTPYYQQGNLIDGKDVGYWHRLFVAQEKRIRELADEVAKLEDNLAISEASFDELSLTCDRLEASLEQMQAVVEAMRRIVQWSEAYPLDVFPEPDFKKAHKLLKAGGMTLDAISASNMRHVVEGVGKIAKESLAALDEHEWQHPMTLREIMESEEKAD